MRITHDTLMKIVNDTVAQRARQDRGLLTAFLGGSMLRDDYMLGGTTDIDLFLVYTVKPQTEREIIRLTDEVHLDIAHHDQRDYSQTRQLRVHPWLGPLVNEAKAIYDPQHFLDFTQASVRGQYDRADHIYARVRTKLEEARRIWMSSHIHKDQPGPLNVLAYLQSISSAINAISSLNGPPLPERRLLLHFPARAAAAGKPGMYQGVLGLLGTTNASHDLIMSWVPLWEQAFYAVPKDVCPARLNVTRKGYYSNAIHAMLGGSQPESALWPLLHTWTLAVSLNQMDNTVEQEWLSAVNALGLAGEGFAEKLEALDAFLDAVEETIEVWAKENGVQID